MSTQPPAPSKWAMEAADDIRDDNLDLLGSGRTLNATPIAAIIQRHHVAGQAETVALLEEAVKRLEVASTVNTSTFNLNYALARRLRTHLAQLKGGAP